MNDVPMAPDRVDRLQSFIVAQRRVIAVGNETKAPLSHAPDAARVSLRNLAGITQYEPSEFTFTALAGTRLQEIVARLADKQQYLPFDPLLVDSGATLGGTVAAGLSGPGRFRYGGIRDFLLGVDFISGDGKLIRAGGKVVKNAAGFDIPKFMVGSMGRFAVMTELTFKVFPRPPERQTLRVQCDSHQDAIEQMACAAGATWELDAIDYQAETRQLYLRVCGPSGSIGSTVERIGQRLGRQVTSIERESEIWNPVQSLNWSTDQPIVAKIPVTPANLIPLTEQLSGGLWFSAAGNLLWLSMRNDQEVTDASDRLSRLGLRGTIVKGPTERSHLIGTWPSFDNESRLKLAFDPAGRFPAFS